MQSSNSDDLLHFKDYSNASSSSSPPPAQINVNSPSSSDSGRGGRRRGDPLSDLIYDMSTSAEVISGGNLQAGSNGNKNDPSADGDAPQKVSFLTLEYYQQFFKVDTHMVLGRIVNSMIPRRAGEDYLRNKIGENPDLYGPFWITVTLIFAIAISGNIASYLQYASDNYQWHYNFHLVSYAATCIFIYANFIPGALWALFKYSLKPVEEGYETENSNYTPSLLSLLCIYGYSLSIYIPVAVLWVIQISVLQWLLVIAGALLSGSVLIIVLSPALRNSRYSLFLIISILCAHFLLAAGFKMYFFHMPDHSAVIVAPTLAPIVSVEQQVAVVGDIVINTTVAKPNAPH